MRHETRKQGKSVWRRIPVWCWLAVLVVAAAWDGYLLFFPKSPPSVTLSYTDFLQLVDEGLVASVTISDQNVDGAFVQPVVWPPPAVTPPRKSGRAPSGPPADSGTDQGSYARFSTVLPAGDDSNLVSQLVQQGVIVSAQDHGAASWLADLGIALIPTVLLIAALIVLAQRTQQGQNSVFRFGESRARLYDTERPVVTFADVAGEEDAKGELRELVAFLKEPDRYHALGARLPRGVLLIGPPGTGKTLLARAVAGEAGVPFFSISASEFVELFVGVGASRVRDLFKRAKQSAPAIIFVDEVDAVGRQRGAGLGNGNDEREQTLNQLLVEMDGFDDQTSVIILGSTNRPDVLDPALLRPGRFDRQVTLGFPDRAGREAILGIHTRAMPLDPSVALAPLARRTPGFSGADLANLCNEAALAAARRRASAVGDVDFDEAMDKIVLGTRQATVLSDEERKLVAYHESGHALVAKLMPGGDPVSRVTIIPHGRSLGATEQLPEEDRHNYPRAYLLGRLAVMLGGRAAEDLVFRQPTTGAENDLKQATALARRMVGLWGMDPEMGLVSYGVGETHPFLGRELAQPRDFAELTAYRLDQAVRATIDEAYQNARETLEAHVPLLTTLAEELMRRETIDGKRLDELLSAALAVPIEEAQPAERSPDLAIARAS